jgi:hypothetical protein
MLGYQLVWLIAVICALASGIAVVGFGSYLLRRVVEDFSNSTDWRAFLVRGFRGLPGVGLLIFGCALLLIAVLRIAALHVPAPLPGSSNNPSTANPAMDAAGAPR